MKNNRLSFRQAVGLWLLGSKAAGKGAPPLFSTFLSGQPYWSDWSTQQAVRDGYAASVWVYACVRKLSSTASSVPWIAERRNADGKWEREEGHPLEVLLRSPNAMMSGQDLFERITQNLNLGGNAPLYLNLVRNSPAEIWPLPPDQIKPVPGNGWIQKYEYTPPGSAERITYEPQQIAHLMFADPGNYLWGIAPLKAASMTVDTDVEAVKWNKVSLQNRAVTDGVFSFAEPLTYEQWDEARKQVREQYQGADNAHMPWVLGGGAKWEDMSRSPVEMDFIEGRRMNREEICAVFQVPPVLVGILDKATYSNYEQAVKSFWQDTIVTYLRDVSAALNLALIPFFDQKAAARARGQLVEADLRIRPDLSGVEALQDNLTGQVETASKLFAMGVPFSQINQRLSLGFDDFPGADEPWRPLNLVPGGGGTVSSQPTQMASRVPYTRKAFNLFTEEQKSVYWKAFDRHRQGWEGVITQRVKDLFAAERDKIIKDFKDGQMDVDLLVDPQKETWTNLITATWHSVIEAFGGQTAQSLGGQVQKSWMFDPWDQAIQSYVAMFAAQKVTSILNTTKTQLRTQIQDGLDNNESIIEIAGRLRDVYDDFDQFRSLMIARTEVIGASAYGNRAAAVQSGAMQTHTWISSRDNRVRESHSAVDGETVPLDQPYSNGLMFPGDPGGSGDEVIMCRCVEAFGSLR